MIREASAGARPSRAWFLLVVVVALVAYARSFTAVFQFDDYQHIVENPAVRQPSVGTLARWGRTRIIPTATLALNYRLGGENVVGYHLVNLAIHLMACWVVFALVIELCRTPRVRDTWLARHARELAVATALLCACHPIQVQAVTYVVQRMSSLAACFYFAAVLWYLRARNAATLQRRRPTAYAIAVLFAIAAFCSKENTASLPVVILLGELVLFAGTGGIRARFVRVAPFLLLMLALPLTFTLLSPPVPSTAQPADSWLEQQREGLVHALTRGADAPADVTPLDYLRTQWVVIPQYLRLVFLPWGFNIDHDVSVIRNLTGGAVAGLLLLLMLLALAIYATRKQPLLGFGVLWFFIALSVESSVFPIRDLMNEHRMYLAMPGVALVVAIVFVAAVQARPLLARGAGVAVVVLLTGITIARNEVWQTQLGLWQDALAKSPHKARVHVNVGTALHLQGEVKEAIRHYCEALKLEPTNRRADSNINIALDQLVEDGEAEMMIASIGPDGAMELEARHPCPPSGKSQ